MMIEVAMHPVIDRAALASNDASDFIYGIALRNQEHCLNPLIYFDLLGLTKGIC